MPGGEAGKKRQACRLSRLPEESLVDGLLAGTVLVETTSPLESVTVVVTEPSALVVTLVVSVDVLLLELDPVPLELAPELALLLPDRSEDATEALVALMDMLTGRIPAWLMTAASIARKLLTEG